MRFVERRAARSAPHAWLGPVVAEAREPKLLAETTRLAPAARPPAAAGPVPDAATIARRRRRAGGCS